MFYFTNTSIELSSPPLPPVPPVPKSKSKSGAIIGGAVGGVFALVLLAVIAWFAFRLRRNRQNSEPNQEKTDGPTGNQTSGRNIPLTEPTPVKGDTDRAASPILNHPADQMDLPPTYEAPSSPTTSQTRPNPLQIFAAAHPEWITSDLELKLRSAGYNPALDPDLMSSEHWLDKYGVDEFELAALKEAYRA